MSRPDLMDVIDKRLAEQPVSFGVNGDTVVLGDNHLTIELSVNQYRTFCRKLGLENDPSRMDIPYKNGTIVCHKRRSLI